jgi:hypothetical protein
MANTVDLMTYSQKLVLDDSGFNSGMKNAESKFSSFGSTLGGIGAGIGKTIGIGLVTATTALTGFAISGVKLASDLSEVQNVVDTTFGSNASQIDTWAKNAATSFGMSELSAKQMTGTMGAMLKSMGLSSDEVLDMSTSITGLAGDFASFYNLDSEDAFNKIRAGISGETEPLKQLGINMSVANLEAFALSQGIDKSFQSMTQAEQATLRYNYLMATTADTQGDFSKTSDSMANQMRIAQLKVEDLSASFGTMLLPIVNDGLTGILDFVDGAMPAFNDLFTGFTGLLTGVEGSEKQFSDGASVIVNKFVQTLSTLIPKAVQVVANLLPAVATSIMTNLPILITEVMKIIPQISKTLLSMMPMFLDSGVQIILSLVQGIAESLPTLIPQIVDTVIVMATTLIDNIDLIIDAGIQLLNGLVEGLIEALPTIIEKLPELVIKIASAIIENAPKMLEASVNLILQLGLGLWEGLSGLEADIASKAYEYIVKPFLDFGADMINVGTNLIQGLWQGISDAGEWLWEKISGFFGGVVDGIKDFFGIASPSKIFRDEIGTYLAQGIGVGFSDEMVSVTKDMQKALPTSFTTKGLISYDEPLVDTAKTNALLGNTYNNSSTNSQPISIQYTAGDIVIHGNTDKNTVENIDSIINKSIDEAFINLAGKLSNQFIQKTYSY